MSLSFQEEVVLGIGPKTAEALDMISFSTTIKTPTIRVMIVSLLFILVVLIPYYSAFPFESERNSPNHFNKGSRLCLGCHDGTLASNVINRDFYAFGANSKGVPPGHFDRNSDHPVGIDYRLAQLRSRGRLKDPSMLDPAIKLEDGYVSCTSCHNPNSPLRARLVMSNSGSRLCFSCHNL